jgi:hypothetical protein
MNKHIPPLHMIGAEVMESEGVSMMNFRVFAEISGCS